MHNGIEVHNCSDTNHICAFTKSSSYIKYSLMLLPFCHHLNLKALQNPLIWCRSYLKFIYITYALQTWRSSFKWIEIFEFGCHIENWWLLSFTKPSKYFSLNEIFCHLIWGFFFFRMSEHWISSWRHQTNRPMYHIGVPF